MQGLVFLSQGALAGLALAALPFIIHLISKRRARRVRFAAMEFVLKSQKRTARSVRLRQLLLLLLRTLLVVAMALAIARPVWRDEPEAATTNAPLVVVLAIDGSASMRATLDGKSAFVRARQKAEAALRELPDDVRVAAVLCTDVVKDLVGAPSFDRRPVLDQLAALQPGYGTSDLSACVARGREVARLVPGEGERRVVVFSDLAAHAFPGGAVAGDGAGLAVEWVPAWDEDPPPNHGLVSVAAARTTGPAGDGVQVTFQVARYGGTDVEVPADLVVGGRRAARLMLPLVPGATIERTFTHGVAADADPAAPATDDDLTLQLGDDALDVDDQAVLPFDMPRPVKVVVVDGAPQPIPFKDEVFYLESALRQAKGARARLTVDVVAPEQLNAAALAGARVVVLANVARLEDSAAAALLESVKAGAGLLLTMGDQVDVEWMNAALAGLLPGQLRGAKGQALLDDAAVAESLSLTRFLVEHPALRALSGAGGGAPTGAPGAVAEGDEAGGELVGLSRVRTHTLMLMEPDAKAEREVLARFSNEAPALVERRVGEGRVLLLATTIDRDWSDLAIRPGFLPLVQQVVLYLAGALQDSGPRILEVSAPRDIVPPRGSAAVEVRAPDGTTTRIPVVVDTPDAAREGRAPAGPGVRYTGTTMPGLYRVYAIVEGGEPREVTGERFSVLAPRGESDLSKAPPDVLAAAVPSGAIVRGGEPENGDFQLWPMLLLFAVFVVGVEALVTKRSAA